MAHANLNWAKTTVNQFNRIHELQERSKIIPHEVAIQLQMPFRYLLSKANMHIPHEHCLKESYLIPGGSLKLQLEKNKLFTETVLWIHSVDCTTNNCILLNFHKNWHKEWVSLVSTHIVWGLQDWAHLEYSRPELLHPWDWIVVDWCVETYAVYYM